VSHADRMYRRYARASSLKAMVDKFVMCLGLRAEVTVDPHYVVVITPGNADSMKEIDTFIDGFPDIRHHKIHASTLMPYGAITIDARC
jgi:hypothetical protein